LIGFDPSQSFGLDTHRMVLTKQTILFI